MAIIKQKGKAQVSVKEPLKQDFTLFPEKLELARKASREGTIIRTSVKKSV